MVNRSAEVIVVGQVDRPINICPNMVRFRIRPDFLVVFFFFCYFCILIFDFFSFVVIAAVYIEFKTMCCFGNMSLSYAFQ